MSDERTSLNGEPRPFATDGHVAAARANADESRDGLQVTTEYGDELPPPPSRKNDEANQSRDKPSSLPTVQGYEIVRVLGRGGMGVVYLARQVNLNRMVALKILLGGAHQRHRFRAEVEAVAALRHPNIVQIHDVGETDGVPYCALEYVDGGTLEDAVAGRPVAPLDAALCVETLSRAAQFAHEHGIVHRDLKPANVLLPRDTGGQNDRDARPLAHLDQAKIADFGLAKHLENDSGLTGTGAILGTPSYMAPEQAEGGSRGVGPSADIYALGAILYELLTGRPPFHGVSGTETILLVLSADPVAPAQLQPNVPRDLETVCLKCLEKDPRKRYASAADLAEELLRFRDGRPVLARRAAWPERMAKWARRRPAAAALIGVTAAAAGALAGLGYGYYENLRQHNLELESANTSITRQRQRAEDNLDSAAAAVDQMLTRVSVLRLAGVPHADQIRADLLEDALRFYDRLLSTQEADSRLLLVQARAMERTGSILVKLGRSDQARDRYERALGLTRPLRDNAPDEVTALPVSRLEAQIHSNLGLLFTNANDLTKALAAHRTALAARERLCAIAPENTEVRFDLAASCINLAVIARRQDQPDLRGRYLSRARDEARELVKAQPMITGGQAASDPSLLAKPGPVQFAYLLATTLNDLGVYHLDQDQAHAAVEPLEEGVKVWRQLVETVPNEVDYRAGLARGLSNLGSAWRDQLELGKARPLYQESLDIRARLAADHADVWSFGLEHAWGLLRLGQLHQDERQYDASIAALTDAVTRLDRFVSLAASQGRAREPLREALVTRAEILSSFKAKHAEALADVDKAIGYATGEKLGETQMVRALVLARTGDRNRATSAANEILARSKPSAKLLFEAARVFAALANGSSDAAERELSAARSVQLLVQARAAAYFTTMEQRQRLERDGDLAVLRNRADFAALWRQILKKE